MEISFSLVEVNLTPQFQAPFYPPKGEIKHVRVFAPLLALRETLLCGKKIREFVAASSLPRRGK